MPPPSKKARLFAFMDTPSRPTIPEASSEVEAYLAAGSTSSTDDQPLTFWKANATKYPKLSRVAKKFLAVPATSAPIERIFSHARNILQANRAHLLPKNFEQLLLLKVNNQAN